jgi:hypothetical protein
MYRGNSEHLSKRCHADVKSCAGPDVHKKTVTACVRVPGVSGDRVQHVRTFATTTADLPLLRDWLEAHRVGDVRPLFLNYPAEPVAHWTGVRYRGPAWVSVPAPLRHIPLFLREGASLDLPGSEGPRSTRSDWSGGHRDGVLALSSRGVRNKRTALLASFAVSTPERAR